MLEIGHIAKDFTLQDANNNQVSLSDFRGQKVVLYFYPKDDTPGCTKQACAFRDVYGEFVKNKIIVLGINRDNQATHKKFAEKYHLPFILLSDLDGTIVEAFDAKGIFGTSRTTYIIDENGIIEKVFAKASPDTNAADILKYLSE